MRYFLVVYDQRAGRLLELDEFGAEERAEALRQRFAREALELDNPSIEVVVLGAESRNALRRTHGRYFQTAAELAANF